MKGGKFSEHAPNFPIWVLTPPETVDALLEKASPETKKRVKKIVEAAKKASSKEKPEESSDTDKKNEVKELTDPVVDSLRKYKKQL
ncbi:MAG: hypothetical protein R3A13_00460 [Bdellovibrionota bacterium]